MAVNKAEKTVSGAAKKSAGKTSDKKALAQILFTRNNLSGLEISERVGVSDRTIREWIKKGNWELQRKSLLVTKDEHIRCFLDQISALNEAILNNRTELKYADTKQADIYVKLTAALKNCYTETGLNEILEISQQILAFAQANFPEHIKVAILILDAYVNQHLK